MNLDLTQANYNLASRRLQVLLGQDLKNGSAEEIEAMELARFLEDFELSRGDCPTWEPSYLAE